MKHRAPSQSQHITCRTEYSLIVCQMTKWQRGVCMHVSVRRLGCGINETWWVVLGGHREPRRPLISALCCLPQVIPGRAKPKEVERKGGKDKDYQEWAREKERGETREREKDGRGGRKLAMNICYLSVPSPTGSENPRIRCTAAAVATPALSNTNTMALLSQTKLERWIWKETGSPQSQHCQGRAAWPG